MFENKIIILYLQHQRLIIMETEKIVIGITHGDINGIGYEVILKTLADNRVYDSFIPVIYGSSKVAAFYRKHLDIQGVNLNIIQSVDEAHAKRINLINCTEDDLKVEFGQSTPESRKSSFQKRSKWQLKM